MFLYQPFFFCFPTKIEVFYKHTVLNNIFLCYEHGSVLLWWRVGYSISEFSPRQKLVTIFVTYAISTTLKIYQLFL